MQIVYAKLISAGVVALINILAGIVLVPCHKWVARQSNLPYVIAFTGGTLFSVALTQTLPDADSILDTLQTVTSFPVSHLLFGAGFLAMYMVGISTRAVFGESISNTARTAYLDPNSSNRLHLPGPKNYNRPPPPQTATDGVINDFAHLIEPPAAEPTEHWKQSMDIVRSNTPRNVHSLEEEEAELHHMPSTSLSQSPIIVQETRPAVVQLQRQQSVNLGTLRAVTVGILIETLVSGVAVGIQQRMSGVLITAFAIVTHDWWESTGLSIQYIKAGKGPFALIMVSIAIALTFVLGVVGGVLFTDVFHVNVGEEISAGMVSFASGVFVYVALVEMIMQQDTDDHGAFMANQDKNHHKRNMKKAIVATVAFFAVSLFALAD